MMMMPDGGGGDDDDPSIKVNTACTATMKVNGDI
jgi:hypothetical protein